MNNVMNTEETQACSIVNTEIPLDSIDSKALARVLEEMQNMNGNSAYDRVHNRHNR